MGHVYVPVGFETYAFGLKKRFLHVPTRGGATNCVDDPMAGQSCGFGRIVEYATHQPRMTGPAGQ